MDEAIYIGFAILVLSKLHLYQLSYVKLHSYFGQENLQCHCIHTDAFVLSLNTANILKD